jgi:hypothetical protein
LKSFQFKTKLNFFPTGFWIRETKEATDLRGSLSIFESTEDDDRSDGLDYQTESYHIADLFVASTTPK